MNVPLVTRGLVVESTTPGSPLKGAGLVENTIPLAVINGNALGAIDPDKVALLVVTFVNVPVVTVAKAGVGGVNSYIWPVAGLVPMLFVSVEELNAGLADEFDKETKFPLPVATPEIPIEADPPDTEVDS